MKGEISRAAALFAEAAEIATAIGDKRHICFARGGLGWSPVSSGVGRMRIKRLTWDAGDVTVHKKGGVPVEEPMISKSAGLLIKGGEVSGDVGLSRRADDRAPPVRE